MTVNQGQTANLKVNPVLGSPPTMDWKKIDELLIDPIYQRSIDSGASQALIRKIAINWNWDLCQPLAISRRSDGSFAIVDGQHRAEAARKRGDIAELPCVISDYASASKEAAAFVAINQMRRPLNALELFKAAVAAEETEALAILSAITDAGLRLANHNNYTVWKVGDISNIGGIQSTFRRKGENVLRVALSSMALAWPNKILQYCGSVFPGFVAIAVDELRLGASQDKIIKELSDIASTYSQADWRRRGETLAAENGGGRGQAMASVFRSAWRSRNSSKTLVLESDHVGWCDQCDKRVTEERVLGCTDRHCSMKQIGD